MTHITAQHTASGVLTIYIHILETYVAQVTAEDAEEAVVVAARGLEVAQHVALTVEVNPCLPVTIVYRVVVEVEGCPVLDG